MAPAVLNNYIGRYEGPGCHVRTNGDASKKGGWWRKIEEDKGVRRYKERKSKEDEESRV